METHTFNFKREIVSTKVLLECNEPLKVQILTFWDAHGKKIPWEGRNGKKTELVKANSVKIEEAVERWSFSQNESTDFTVWNLYLDGVKYRALDLASYSKAPRRDSDLVVRAVVGQG